MKDNEREDKLVGYLYGELSADERRTVEEVLKKDPDALRELDRLRGIHSLLGTLKDKEVIAPSYLVEQAKGARPLYPSPWVRVSLSIAASLVLLMTAARLTGLEMRYQDSELRIFFGGTRKDEADGEPLTALQVQEMINTSLHSQQESFNAGWADLKQEMENSIRKNVNQGMKLSPAQVSAITNQVSNASNEQVSGYVATMQAENLKQIQDYLKLSSKEQNQYIEGLLVDFAKYLQEQRRQDFQLLQTRVSSLEQNNNVFREETEQILTSLISNVGQSKKAN
jgi:hypothetical protein